MFRTCRIWASKAEVATSRKACSIAIDYLKFDWSASQQLRQTSETQSFPTIALGLCHDAH